MTDERERWRRHIVERCADDGSGCWIWQLSIGSHGYGATRVPGAPRSASVTTASRLAFLAWNGELGPGEEPRHTCNNKRCCNPAHLIRGSHRDNAMDAQLAGVLAKKLTPDLVRSIRERRAGGQSQEAIARAIGVCKKTVQRVLRGAAWTHVAEAR